MAVAIKSLFAFPNISINFVLGMIGLFLYITYPTLRDGLNIFLILLIGVQVFGKNKEARNESFFTAVPIFLITTVIAFIVFTTFNLGSSAENVVASSVPFLALVAYYLVAASVEEDVFRDVLPQRIGMFWSNVLFAVFHYGVLVSIFAGMGVATLAGLNHSAVVAGLIFSFVFGMGMSLLTNMFNSTTPAKAVHWMYNLFKTGVVFSVLAVVA